jgi:hypothetical protein
MSTFGEILSQLHDRSQIYDLLADIDDSALVARFDKAAGERGEDPCEFALRAVQAFTCKANNESWVKLIGHIQAAQSPAGACLSEMIPWSLTH